MELVVTGELWWWSGPAPYHFLTVPPEGCERIEDVARVVSYGWGMVPVTATVGATTWTTSLWPKDGGYVLPVKAAVRRAEGLELDNVVEALLLIDV